MNTGRKVFVIGIIVVLLLGAVGGSLFLLADSDGDDDEVEVGGSVDAPTVPTVAAADSVPFRDPQGAYTLALDPAWQQGVTPGAEAVETWFTDTGTASFRDNLTVAAQDDIGVSLADYMRLVDEQARESVDDFALREFRVVVPEGNEPVELGLMAYEGRQGEREYGFLLVASVEDGDAALATLTTEGERFDSVRTEVEPYLMTLRQT